MQAIVLAAGFGARLRARGPVKPLVGVAGRPLLEHVLTGLAAAGVDEAVIALGAAADAIETAAAGWGVPIRLRFARVADASLPNGVSALAAAPYVEGRCLLVMADHLVDPELYRRVGGASAEAGTLWLGVDRRLDHPWVDPDDVTRVLTEGDAIRSIGKGMANYNGHDTGVFSVDASLFAALSSFPDPSLSQAVACLAGCGLARAVETGDLSWIDVDDPRSHDQAQAWFAGTCGRTA